MHYSRCAKTYTLLVMTDHYTIVGLGNPGEKYEHTRHNIGRAVLNMFLEKHSGPAWHKKSHINALVSEVILGDTEVQLILPETYMNNSGSAIKKVVTNTKQAEQVIVVYDDSDIALGDMKLSFGRGAGGHKGVESIIQSLGTKDFIRVRIGITPITFGGKMRKVFNHKEWILKTFSKKEQEILFPIMQNVQEALEVIIVEGKEKAMNQFN